MADGNEPVEEFEDTVEKKVTEILRTRPKAQMETRLQMVRGHPSILTRGQCRGQNTSPIAIAPVPL